MLAAFALATVGTGAALLAYATQVEPYWLRIRRIELELRCLPRELDGLTVLHLSDFHVHERHPEGENLLRVASRIEADVVCMTGDYGDVPLHAPEAAALLQAARGRLGTFAVLGNHDYNLTGHKRPHRFHDDVGLGVAAALEARGAISVLRNRAAPIRVGDARLWIVGLDDPHTFRDDVAMAYRDVPPGEPSIAIAHSHEPTADASARGARLFLAGHTHGGQVSFPRIGPPLHQTFRRPERTGGLQWVGRTALHISPGLGGSHQLRFRVRPEATLFTLRSL